MKEKLESLSVKLAKRLEEAEQDAKWARAPDEHYYHQTRAEELGWYYNEIMAILREGDAG